MLPENNSNDTYTPSCGYGDVFLICHDIADMVTDLKIKKESMSLNLNTQWLLRGFINVMLWVANS